MSTKTLTTKDGALSWDDAREGDWMDRHGFERLVPGSRVEEAREEGCRERAKEIAEQCERGGWFATRYDVRDAYPEAFTEDEVLALAVRLDDFGIAYDHPDFPEGVDSLDPTERAAVDAILAAADDIERSRTDG